ncbi:AAA family ATPase [Sulfuracidifex metallicus]|uniref:AAA family ATPase n=2 Tax=Sulfuracidifex metallicus TaxID=47303 RepID=A0A6A9QIP3_SULME|nr:AAA family ATPase [Sulfuracidifex metallicus]MUN28090.1 AAA family ATPase [Sulfuracidifex metallicus DSM 6482 = JCM 9184]WOE51366.1 AAA family ATPase [Sulfuracidifex metallicus DSM 6482 = JCM 9184]
MRISEFLFSHGSLVSIYGVAGSGKTSIAMQVSNELSPSILIADEGDFEKRSFKSSQVYFAEVSSTFEIFKACLSLPPGLRLISVDPVNGHYRMERSSLDFLKLMTLLRSISQSGIKVLLTWNITWNDKVSGEKFMRRFSDDIFMVNGKTLIGNLRECDFRITKDKVIGCL